MRECSVRGDRAKVSGAGRGQCAEQAAARYLELRGLTVIERNFRCRVGEIDIIAEEQGELVFVEVRLRNHKYFGTGADSVTHLKQRKLTRAARYYLLQHANRYRDEPICRFDVLSMRQPDYATRARWQVQWIKDAFSP